MMKKRVFLFVVSLLGLGLFLTLFRDSRNRSNGEETPTEVAPPRWRGGPDTDTLGSRTGDTEPSSPPTLPEGEGQKRSGPVPEDAHGLIEEALHASDPEERAFALSELGLLGPQPEILDACYRGLEDQDEEVRLEAVLALEMLEDPGAVQALEEVMERDPSPRVREAASESREELLLRIG